MDTDNDYAARDKCLVSSMERVREMIKKDLGKDLDDLFI